MDMVEGLKVCIESRVYVVHSLQDPADKLRFINNFLSILHLSHVIVFIFLHFSFTVQIEGGEQCRLTVAQYFKECYRKLKFLKLPCLHIGSPLHKVFFPLELCSVQWPAMVQRNLSFWQLTAFIAVCFSLSIIEA